MVVVMFVIITYDVGEVRVNKVRKQLKKYLIWSQNSVFEGEITQGKLHKCLSELQKIIKRQEDSIYVYSVSNPNNIAKDTYGLEKSVHDMFV